MTRSLRSIGPAVVLLLCAGCGDGGDDGGSMEPCAATGLEVPDVSGDWLVTDPMLAASDCSDLVNEVVEDAVDDAEDCVFTVNQDGATVTALDCGDIMYQGCVDQDGNVTLGATEQDSDLGCTVRVDAELAANLTASPAPGSLALNIRTSGTCGGSNCLAVIDATVTSLEAEVASGSRTALPNAVLHRLLP